MFFCLLSFRKWKTNYWLVTPNVIRTKICKTRTQKRKNHRHQLYDALINAHIGTFPIGEQHWWWLVPISTIFDKWPPSSWSICCRSIIMVINGRLGCRRKIFERMQCSSLEDRKITWGCWDNFWNFGLKDGDLDLHCTSFCAALSLFQYNNTKQHKINKLFRKNKTNNKQKVSLMF